MDTANAQSGERLTLKKKILRHFGQARRNELRLERNLPLAEDIWQKIPFTVNDYEITCIYREAREPKGLVAFSSGLRAPTAAYKSMIEELNKQGLSVLIMELPQPEDYDQDPKEFYDHFKDILKAFYTDKDSPLQEIIKERAQEIPVFHMTHSTSGLLYTDLMIYDDDFKSTLIRSLTPCVHISPFFSASNMSKFTGDPLEGVLKWLFKQSAEDIPADTIIGNLNALRLSLLKNGSLRDLKSAPRFGDILKLIENGERVIEKLETSLKITHLPQTFLLSHNDPHACHRTAKIAAGRLGASTRETAGEHNPLDGDPILLEKLIQALEDLKLERDILIEEVKIQLEAATEYIRGGEKKAQKTNLPLVDEIMSFFNNLGGSQAADHDLNGVHPDMPNGQDDNPQALKGRERERMLRTMKSLIGDYAAKPLLQNNGQPLDAPSDPGDDPLYTQETAEEASDEICKNEATAPVQTNKDEQPPISRAASFTRLPGGVFLID